MPNNFIRNVLIKTLILFLIINLIFVGFYQSDHSGSISLYNTVFPGRPRFPFGESPQTAYNFSLNNVNAMYASHEINNNPGEETFKVLVLGDSSIWGTLLKPEETLSGLLNAANIQTCEGQSIRFYNLGYPTISLTKDLMVLEQSLQYDPDLILWPMTLEAFPAHKQLASPLAANNLNRIQALNNQLSLGFIESDLIADKTFWDKTIVGSRRELADLIRLQLYGVMWAATGIDQDYPEDFTPAAIDLESDTDYYSWAGPTFPPDALSFLVLDGAQRLLADTEFLIINEPMLISNGQNSEIQYNFFYPRWAYDQYRVLLSDYTTLNQIPYLDAWDMIPMQEFTNSAIHLTPEGEMIFAEVVKQKILDMNWACK
ncbi:MAG: hypothetical protein JEZ06_08395 [Anaerolineaceae bacterium]|nr:hypothetical protein [Anaerolineaceae bacterium]